MDITKEEIDPDTDSLSKEKLFEEAQTRGIEETTARFTLDRLKDDGEMTNPRNRHSELNYLI